MVALEIDAAPVTMAQGADAWSNQSPISLTAGRLVAISLKVKGLKGALAVRWTTNGVAWQTIPAACLYSQTVLEHLRTSYLRFLKAASLGTALSLTAQEVAYLAVNPDLLFDGKAWLNSPRRRARQRLRPRTRSPTYCSDC